MAARPRRARLRARGAARVRFGIEALFRLHWPRAYRAAYLVVHDAAAAEDIAQEAFLAAVRDLDRFDRRRPFGPWLHRIVVNRAIDWTRARQLRGEAELVDASHAPTSPAPLDASLLGALAALPPEHRAVIVLRHLLEYTPGEIAELLGLPRGTVNSRLRRGLDSLKESCEDGARADRDPGRARGARALLERRRDGVREREPAPRAGRGSRSRRSRSRSPSSPALLSPPGRAVLDEIREVVGVERAQPALFSLPAPGRLLVTADSGAWVVERGRLEAAARRLSRGIWSPFGRFVVARARTSSSR